MSEGYDKEEAIVKEEVDDKEEQNQLIKCSMCEYTTLVHENLRMHIEYNHEQMRHGCDYESSSEHTLERHVKAIHEECDSLKCEFCEYVTKSLGCLKVHMRTRHGNERYPCQTCEYVAKIPSALNQHIKKVHGSQRYPCTFCEYVTKIPSSLKRHISTQHSNMSDSKEESHLCDQCSFIADSAVALKKHVEQHAPLAFPCTQCDYKTRNAKNLKDHIYKQHMNKDRYLCDKCDFTTNTNQKMTKHKERVHEGLTYPCEFCGFVATFKVSLIKHIRRKHGNERHACYQCSYVGKSPDSLKHHIRINHDGVRFPCPDCEYEATRKYNLYDHSRKVHKKELDKSCFNTPVVPEIPVKKIFYQEEKKPKFLAQKEETFPEQKYKVPSSSLQCNLENKFASGEFNKCAEDTKTNPLNEEGNIFDDTNASQQISEHISDGSMPKQEMKVEEIETKKKRKETKSDLFRCEFCQKVLYDEQTLVVHSRVHTGEKPFSCELCGNNYASNKSLKNHSKTHEDGYQGTKKHPCEICGKVFDKAIRLKDHEHTHKGDKPYQCVECGLKCSRSDTLKRHMMKHKGDVDPTSSDIFECEFCQKVFGDKQKLVLHRRVHTGEKPYTMWEKFLKKLQPEISHKMPSDGNIPNSQGL